jgi:probable phosphoglycerate mutase
MSQSSSLPDVYSARRGETARTATHQHRGKTDIPLTNQGQRNARNLGERLRGMSFAKIITSPLERARSKCELAGFDSVAEVDPELMEWDYGRYEGLTTVEIRRQRRESSLFRDGCPAGESVAAVGARADIVVARLRANAMRTLLLGHGHFFRVLAARWLGLPPSEAGLFCLSTASLSVLGYEHSQDEPALRLWNDVRHVTP